jgi:hypothetical protein
VGVVLTNEKLPKYLVIVPKGASAVTAAAWLQRLVRYIGPGFHCDTRFKDYVTGDGAMCFTRAASRSLARGQVRVSKILGEAGIDEYSIALREVRRMLRQGRETLGQAGKSGADEVPS